MTALGDRYESSAFGALDPWPARPVRDLPPTYSSPRTFQELRAVPPSPPGWIGHSRDRCNGGYAAKASSSLDSCRRLEASPEIKGPFIPRIASPSFLPRVPESFFFPSAVSGWSRAPRDTQVGLQVCSWRVRLNVQSEVLRHSKIRYPTIIHVLRPTILHLPSVPLLKTSLGETTTANDKGGVTP